MLRSLTSIFILICLSLGLLSLPYELWAGLDNIIITQVQISGGVGKTTYDFIELYNPTARAIDLKGFRLVKRTASGTSDQTIKSWTSSTVVKPDSYYLWANKDYSELTQITNTTTSAAIANDNGIALRQGAENTGIIIDSLAWGKAQNGLGEGNELPANPPATHSLERIKINGQYQDTNNNLVDFFLQTSPQPQSDPITQITATSSATKTTTTKTSISNSTSDFYTITPLEQVSSLKSGEKITVEGIVAAAPGEISPNIMFLAGSGLQLNLNKSVPNGIKRGQKIRAKGSVSQTKAYGTRLTIKSANDIIILSNENEPEPLSIPIKELKIKHEGWLIATNGQIVQRGDNWFTLEKDSARLRINLRNKAHDWPKLKTHDKVDIVGFITLSQGELRLWPRSPDDINVNNIQTNDTNHTTVNLSREKTPSWPSYFILFVIAALAVGGWLWQKRKLPSLWQLLKNFITKHIKS